MSHRYVEPAPVHALVSLFDDGMGPVVPDRVLPPLWHWAALASWSGASTSGTDGHPRTGGSLPDLGKPRRMFAGGSAVFHAPLRLGELVRQEDRVLTVVPKSGRQGHFLLVRVETTLYTTEGRLAVVESRDLVYRDAAGMPPEALARDPQARHVGRSLLSREEGTWVFRTDPALLMRFSSATSNGHRIHYDWPYATQVEGYPGLVVHGPLMALAMMEVLRLEGVGAGVRSISHRNQRPLFCGQDAEIIIDNQGRDGWVASLVRGNQVHSVLNAST